MDKPGILTPMDRFFEETRKGLSVWEAAKVAAKGDKELAQAILDKYDDLATDVDPWG